MASKLRPTITKTCAYCDKAPNLFSQEEYGFADTAKCRYCSSWKTKREWNKRPREERLQATIKKLVDKLRTNEKIRKRLHQHFKWQIACHRDLCGCTDCQVLIDNDRIGYTSEGRFMDMENEEKTSIRVGRSVSCLTCERQKKPVGRDAPAVMASDFCMHGCNGYYEDPQPDTLWPREEGETNGNS